MQHEDVDDADHDGLEGVAIDDLRKCSMRRCYGRPGEIESVSRHEWGLRDINLCWLRACTVRCTYTMSRTESSRLYSRGEKVGSIQYRQE
jgi:hypothetical protein